MRCYAPAPAATDGEASNPGPRTRRRGPRSDAATDRRRARWMKASRIRLKIEDCFSEDEIVTVAQVNVRGWLTNSAHALAQLHLLDPRPDVVVMSETKLNKSVARPVLAGYDLVARKDNGAKAHGGGVLVYVDPKLTARVTFMGESEDADRVWVMLHSSQGPYLIGAWYRAPSSQVEMSLTSLQTELGTHGSSALGILLVGDMNVHHSRWLSSHSTTPAGEALRGTAADWGMKQLVRGPTHEHGNRLDLVLTNVPDIVTAAVGERITDHNMVLARLRLRVPKAETIKRSVHDYTKADWDLLVDTIEEEDWSCLEGNSVSEAAVNFTERMHEIIDDAIPKKIIREHKGTHPWMDDQVLASVHERNQARGTELEAAAAARCSEIMLSARLEYQERTKSELQEMPPGCKRWWKRSRELLHQQATISTIPALKSPSSSEWCLTPQSKADLLAETFASKSKLEPKTCEFYLDDEAMIEVQTWDPEAISVDHVDAALRCLQEQSATGPDLIATRVLKRCSAALARPIHRLLQRILEEGEWPRVWSMHWMVPIYKRKAAGNPGNYRGVHLTAQVSKVCERLILLTARPHIDHHLLPGRNQFAFTKGRGARDAIAYLVTSWISALNGRCKVGLYCSDVSGAFDRVDSSILMQKLRKMKFNPRLVRLFQSWLQPRTGRVLVGGAKSGDMVLENMVYQGTVLGPELWNLFFADAAPSIRAAEYEEIIYADDLNAFRLFPGDTDNEEILQKNGACQEHLHEWGKLNRVSFDPTKESSHVISQCGSVGGNCKLLGIVFDTQLTMHAAVDDLVNECRWKRMSLLRSRAFYSTDKIMCLWKAHILSFIEYLTPGIFHAADSHLCRVDALQTGFLREIGVPEADALVQFKLAPLCTRRDIAMLGIIHRCVLGRGPSHYKKFFVFADRPSRESRSSVQRHSLQLLSMVDGRQKEITRRSLLGMIDVYNMLPPASVEQSSSVQMLQSLLQQLVLDAVMADTDGWQRILSPRHPLHIHPIRAWLMWQPSA